MTVTPLSGLDPTYDLNGIGTPNTTGVALAAGQELLDADFGYNWVPPGDPTNPPLNATGRSGTGCGWMRTETG